MAHKKAASVFPEPVGARSRVFSPRDIAGQASCWAFVGDLNVLRNQAAVTKWNTPSELDLTLSAVFPDSTKVLTYVALGGWIKDERLATYGWRQSMLVYTMEYSTSRQIPVIYY